MKFVFTSYVSSPEFDQPDHWLKRIRGYTGILESLAKNNKVTSIERINFEGWYEQEGVNYRFTRLSKTTTRFPLPMHRLIRKMEPDVVLVHGLIYPLQVMQLRYALGKKTKIIVQHHAEKPGAGLKKILQRRADRSIDSYLFTSKEMGKEWVQRGIIASEKKITEVMEASSVFSPGDRKQAMEKTKISGKPVFLWVGRLDRNKDPLTVVKAFLAFVKEMPGATLNMIYHTEELKREIQLLLEETNSTGTVRLVGRISHDEMQDWYNSADYILAGSHYEGSGVAVCEAMSCGCIPVLTDIMSFRKMTGNGQCGFLYEAGNVQALLAILQKLPSIDQEKEKYSVLRQFEEELSFEAIADKIYWLGLSLMAKQAHHSMRSVAY